MHLRGSVNIGLRGAFARVGQNAYIKKNIKAGGINVLFPPAFKL